MVPRWPVFVGIAIAVVYETTFVAWKGQTLGKMLLGLRVAQLVNGIKPHRRSSRSAPSCRRRPCRCRGALALSLYLVVLLMAVPSELRLASTITPPAPSSSAPAERRRSPLTVTTGA